MHAWRLPLRGAAFTVAAALLAGLCLHFFLSKPQSAFSLERLGRSGKRKATRQRAGAGAAAVASWTARACPKGCEEVGSCDAERGMCVFVTLPHSKLSSVLCHVFVHMDKTAEAINANNFNSFQNYSKNAPFA